MKDLFIYYFCNFLGVGGGW